MPYRMGYVIWATAHESNDVLFQYDVAADGKRFLINTTGGTGAPSSPPLTAVVNWNIDVKK